MRVSIIIPIYNSVIVYLKECIDSCIKQTEQDIEIILVDDGSGEEQAKTYRQIAGQDNRINYYRQTNQGVSAARNFGIEKAMGEYILFLDADDWIELEACENLYQHATENEVDVLLYGYYSNYVNKQLTRVLTDFDEKLFQRDKLQLAILQGDPDFGIVEIGATLGKFVKRELLMSKGIRYVYGLVQGEDGMFSMCLYEHAQKIAYYPHAYYHYRRSASSVSRKYQPHIIEITNNTLSAYAEFIKFYHKDTSFELALEKKWISVLLSEILPLGFFHHDNTESKEEMYNELKNYLCHDVWINRFQNMGKYQLGFASKIKIRCILRQQYRVLKVMIHLEMWLRNKLTVSYQ